MAYERVFTVDDYYDGPRSGIASYLGRPHHYFCEWDEARGDYSDTFRLTPIDEETFSLAMERWSIWEQWDAAFRRGEVAQSTHPGLPGSNPRYAELQRTLEARLALRPAIRKRKHGTFRWSTEAGEEVEWSDAVASARSNSSSDASE
jgi:hypothetical protein